MQHSRIRWLLVFSGRGSAMQHSRMKRWLLVFSGRGSAMQGWSVGALDANRVLWPTIAEVEISTSFLSLRPMAYPILICC